MRRVLVVATAGLLALLTGCTSAAGTPAAPWGSPVAESSSSRYAICAQLRDAFSDAMGPLGTAMGKMIGAEAADDDDDRGDAADQVVTELKSLSRSLTSIGAGADDDSVKQAVSSTASGIDKLAGDPDFLADVTKITDIPAAIGKISTAAQPLTTACA